MTFGPPIICTGCSRLDVERSSSVATPGFCTAYPNGIPMDILDGADHRKPRGDEADGLIFDKRDDPAADIALEAWQRHHEAEPATT